VNQLYLPGMPVPESVRATSSLAEALAGAEIVVSVMPSPHVRRVFTQMASLLRPETLVVSATKGIEEGTLLRMTEIATEVLRAPGSGSEPHIGALSGPSFAKEVARGDPTAVTVASRDAELASRIQREFSDSNFRIYTHDDVKKQALLS
jgi:glycerol-3-phosphate dehydrogenase (NAD(P)+)